ncbi:hypothetical protein [Pontimicrobium sp. SW4]|uniref:Prolow-density lipoprotein receptor-related protein 1-like beta-propeller domain-containing protein n=1 Tax=Pontimicrobium sp. SW4 TaxID=3153519 RepID=A0AAU7BUX2_9FLAO
MKILSILLLLFFFSSNSRFDNVNNINDNDIYYTSESNSKGRDIYKMSADGSNKQKLTKKIGNGHYPHNINPQISPDGSRIVFQSDPDGHDKYTIWTMNTDGSNLKKITTKEGMYPNWSPNGKKIIFSGRRHGVWEIILIPSEGGIEELLSDNKNESIKPNWGAVCSFHPDGKSIVYSYIRENVLYSLHLESKTKKRLSPEGESFTRPMYSPDGLSIAVNRKKEKGYDLIIMSPKGKELEIVAKNIISYSSPSWSKSGNELLFTGSVKGNQEIFKINLGTKEEKQLTNNLEFDAMPTWN